MSRRDLVAGLGVGGLVSMGMTRAASRDAGTTEAYLADTDRHTDAGAAEMAAGAKAGEEPLVISGVMPRLGVSATLSGPRSEAGIGALMPWGDRLWFVTYTAHTDTTGGGTGLYYVDASMRLHKHPASVVGTYANRFVHVPSEQLFIGPHVIDVHNKVRTIEPLAGYRLTATMAHLHDPANKVYVLGMESELWEVDVRTLDVKLLFTLNFDLKLPAGYKPHYKGGFNAGDRIIVGNNTYHERDAVEGISTGGRLAEWDGKSEWRTVESTAFCDIAGTRMGDHAAAMAIGWDRASVLLNVLTRGKWTRYRLPKASQTFDHAWYTEWPRIREVETERYLIDMHGMFYEAPKAAYGGQYWGLKPICQHLRIVPDFCTWRGMLVLAGDQVTAVTGNAHLVGEPQSNLWFGKTDDLWSFGKPAGWGGVWQDTPVKAGEPSDPFLMTGFDRKCLHLVHDAGEAVVFTIQVDFLGNGRWVQYERLKVPAAGYVHHEFPAGFSAHWVRIVPHASCRATAQFVYT
ncbi:MAG TPA: hypothetical protein PL151_03675 [Phycisphaerae bacterium]|nr:hypothetical protein [Phycisphaerae bacterium]HOM52003.1 hypothetical protein [Phycisphaerae bacterium]HON65723.1 hypothetical protein [Phycisphaerae bacterium]HOQ86467.1 hypothetical protein [Phycisphaerae bacterium]HPU25739.1 hypothetical protein [Phycisphaerae bacterium]